MRIGIMLNEHAGPDSLRLLTDELRRNADEGFDSSWLTHVFGVDALTALAVAGSRVPDIAIGTAVVPTYPRHPGALAQQARTTALAVGPDRLTLGIGLSHQMVIENMYGYDFARPVRHLREYLEVLMPLVDGQAVSFSGETVSANLQLSVPNDDRVPVLVAALGEQMLRLAGKRTDGTVLWMTGPTTIRDHIAPTITAAATEAGRPAPRIVCALPVLVTDHPDSARERAAKVFKIYGSLPSYRAMMDREGAAGPADLAIVGTEDQVAERVRTVFAAGATEFVGIVFADGDDATRTRKLLTDLKS
ncbi:MULTISPECIES: LLM class F420-dependent oxidoreductase [Nocardia]|uniref:LLM class F420-dependent oxidoreductase n=1 Tax=Nocardia TaxID=1817 RepID=UPI000BEF585C|nr:MULTISPECIES: LLM class F420-dependent oxidoreductase [Nocardia]MBF6184333.1 LLM class F420-dependent oxidoreductase [Nocardia farcinica]MBF6310177.1 LLM class F420-dependent oxidoreductase [Nocardia farcinica]MBF6406003.1 LLM class F420-dependent oxidoreductase [Nocardia farcinica]PEH75615.1 LLM class F420-dependent oxidoreductase [Nocardia sp. FDAARGOS_372]UEX25206.1 LLM class F420-dependent oxidoreductase [Nocardia farcinica]